MKTRERARRAQGNRESDEEVTIRENERNDVPSGHMVWWSDMKWTEEVQRWSNEETSRVSR